MENANARRKFLKKAAYAAPVVVALGGLMPTAANAKANSAIVSLRKEIKVERTEIKSDKGQIDQLKLERASLTGKKNQAARQAITDKIQLLQKDISSERTEIRGLRNQIKIIKKH
jgi:septal ring factor EnvC (AmiA/AmiB activator)